MPLPRFIHAALCASETGRIAPSLAPMLSRLFPDRFVPVLLATILLASLLPVRGAAVPVAEGVSTAAIVLLFFLNGVRLPRDEVLHSIRNWKLQGSALMFCFGVMALLGLGAQLATAAFSAIWLGNDGANAKATLNELPQADGAEIISPKE